eukprot:g1479.t1
MAKAFNFDKVCRIQSELLSSERASVKQMEYNEELEKHLSRAKHEIDYFQKHCRELEKKVEIMEADELERLTAVDIMTKNCNKLMEEQSEELSLAHEELFDHALHLAQALSSKEELGLENNALKKMCSKLYEEKSPSTKQLRKDSSSTKNLMILDKVEIDEKKFEDVQQILHSIGDELESLSPFSAEKKNNTKSRIATLEGALKKADILKESLAKCGKNSGRVKRSKVDIEMEKMKAKLTKETFELRTKISVDADKHKAKLTLEALERNTRIEAEASENKTAANLAKAEVHSLSLQLKEIQEKHATSINKAEMEQIKLQSLLDNLKLKSESDEFGIEMSKKKNASNEKKINILQEHLEHAREDHRKAETKVSMLATLNEEQNVELLEAKVKYTNLNEMFLSYREDTERKKKEHDRKTKSRLVSLQEKVEELEQRHVQNLIAKKKHENTVASLQMEHKEMLQRKSQENEEMLSREIDVHHALTSEVSDLKENLSQKNKIEKYAKYENDIEKHSSNYLSIEKTLEKACHNAAVAEDIAIHAIRRHTNLELEYQNDDENEEKNGLISAAREHSAEQIMEAKKLSRIVSTLQQELVAAEEAEKNAMQEAKIMANVVKISEQVNFSPETVMKKRKSRKYVESPTKVLTTVSTPQTVVRSESRVITPETNKSTTPQTVVRSQSRVITPETNKSTTPQTVVRSQSRAITPETNKSTTPQTVIKSFKSHIDTIPSIPQRTAFDMMKLIQNPPTEKPAEMSDFMWEQILKEHEDLIVTPLQHDRERQKIKNGNILVKKKRQPFLREKKTKYASRINLSPQPPLPLLPTERRLQSKNQSTPPKQLPLPTVGRRLSSKELMIRSKMMRKKR